MSISLPNYVNLDLEINLTLQISTSIPIPIAISVSMAVAIAISISMVSHSWPGIATAWWGDLNRNPSGYIFI